MAVGEWKGRREGGGVSTVGWVRCVKWDWRGRMRWKSGWIGVKGKWSCQCMHNSDAGWWRGPREHYGAVRE